MRPPSLLALVAVLFGAIQLNGLAAAEESGIGVALLKMPYRGARNVAELSDVPDYLERGGLASRLTGYGARLAPVRTVALTPGQQREYGEWHRLGLANGHLSHLVAEARSNGDLPVGLLANCSSLLGMLAGLQNATSGVIEKVGLVFIDAHGDFNTPETTLSGMLGGMPVAVSAGLALHNLRIKSRLDPPLPTRAIVLAGTRELDPLEKDLIEGSDVEQISVEDIRRRSERLQSQMDRLSRQNDLIYVHVDMDVLDPREVPGHPLTVPDGPTSRELSAAIELIFRYPKAAAFGVASTPSGEADPEGISLEAAYRLIEGAVRGVQARP